MAHLSSHGRGGAGNIVDSSRSPKLQPKDLETPVLRTSVVTTGRGGTGNMAKNTDPEETRARQDVDPVHRRLSNGATHVGRGGTGNVFKPGSKEAEAAAAARGSSALGDDASSRKSSGERKSGERKSGDSQHSHSHSRGEPERGLAAKGKDWLLGKKQ